MSSHIFAYMWLWSYCGRRSSTNAIITERGRYGPKTNTILPPYWVSMAKMKGGGGDTHPLTLQVSFLYTYVSVCGCVWVSENLKESIRNFSSLTFNSILWLTYEDNRHIITLLCFAKLAFAQSYLFFSFEDYRSI